MLKVTVSPWLLLVLALLGVIAPYALVAGRSPLVAQSRPPLEVIEEARGVYPPPVTQAVLSGRAPVDREFDACIIDWIGEERLSALRSGRVAVTGLENDLAAVCLARVGVSPGELAAFVERLGGAGQPGPSTDVGPSVEHRFISSVYRIAPGGASGSFKTGQQADIMLSGIDFNDTGGPLLFNHPSGIASDGTRLFLADTLNNRVLIWNTAPAANVSPDFVLGQDDFTSNTPGSGRDRLNWPVSVATDGRRLAVADTFNDRILIWNTFPMANGAPADLVIQGGREQEPGLRNRLPIWPWGVWMDGRRLVVSSTGSGAVLIWNEFPAEDNQPADLVLRGGGMIGTPRQIAGDGVSLIVGDHNARVPGKGQTGAFFWKNFPTTSDEPFDFFMSTGFPWLRGGFAPDGRLVLLSNTLRVWNSLPVNADQLPDVALTRQPCAKAGDYESTAFAGGRLYISCGNDNKVVGFDTTPTESKQEPGFVIGSPGLQTNTLDTNFFIQNGVPASNGRSLFITSDFDARLYVWRNLPDQSGAHPNLVYTFRQDSPWDNALWNDTFVVAGGRGVRIWRRLPLDGNLPDLTLTGGIGSVRFGELRGVALDDRYFYLADAQAERVYIWEGLPDASSEPKYVLAMPSPRRLHSDGAYLIVTGTFDHTVRIYRVAELSAGAQSFNVGGPGRLNLPEGATSRNGQLFIADTPHSRVLAWQDIEEAIAGKWPPDIVLGAPSIEDRRAQIGRDRLFWPGAPAFDGSYLWVGEFKFGNRILRFSPPP